MKKVLFLDHGVRLGGAELTLLEIARQYRTSSTVVLFDDGPPRLAFDRAGIRVRAFPTRWAREGRRRGNPRITPLAVWETMVLAARVARLARDHDLVYANSQKAMIVAAVARLLVPGRSSGRTTSSLKRSTSVASRYV